MLNSQGQIIRNVLSFTLINYSVSSVEGLLVDAPVHRVTQNFKS